MKITIFCDFDSDSLFDAPDTLLITCEMDKAERSALELTPNETFESILISGSQRKKMESVVASLLVTLNTIEVNHDTKTVKYEGRFSRQYNNLPNYVNQMITGTVWGIKNHLCPDCCCDIEE